MDLCPKMCLKCLQEKPLFGYYKKARSPDGHGSRCKECTMAYIRQRRAEGYRGNVAKYAESTKRWQQSERGRAMMKARPGATKKQYYNTKGATLRRAKRRALLRNAYGSWEQAEWDALKAHYTYCCLRCGKAEPEIKLTFDHVIPLCRGGDNTIENAQPLCFNCNSIKHLRTVDYRPERSCLIPNHTI